MHFWVSESAKVSRKGFPPDRNIYQGTRLTLFYSWANIKGSGSCLEYNLVEGYRPQKRSLQAVSQIIEKRFWVLKMMLNPSDISTLKITSCKHVVEQGLRLGEIDNLYRVQNHAVCEGFTSFQNSYETSQSSSSVWRVRLYAPKETSPDF